MLKYRGLAAVLCVVMSVGPMEAQRRQSLPGDRKTRTIALGNYDVRDAAAGAGGAPSPVAETTESVRSQGGIAARIKRGAGGRPISLTAENSVLTAPSTGNGEEIVRKFLKTESALFSFLPQDRDQLRLLMTDDAGGLTVVHFQQYAAGLPIYEATLKAALTAKGELLRVDALRLMSQAPADTRATLTAPEAIRAAYRANRQAMPGAVDAAGVTREGRVFYRVQGGPEIAVERTLFSADGTALSLAFRMFIDAGPNAYYEMIIEARGGALLLRRNLIQRAGQGRVWTESPVKGARQLVTFPGGWLPAAGQITVGNNTDTYVDANGDGQPDVTAQAGLQNGRAMAASQVFDFAAPETPGLKPANYKPASITNLFYLVNTAHDLYYGLGFKEAAGNFQTDNFSLGGAANDPVQARAQAGDSFGNSSFATLPDGIPGVMRIGIFPSPVSFSANQDHDGAYDGTVVVHEYGHGVSSRMIGGPANTGCLFNVQSGAMAEGWSDYFSASFFSNPIIGAYAAEDPAGFRRQSYDNYTFTYEDVGNTGYEVHDDGEVWAATLWDARKTLSAAVMDKLVLNAYKLTPCNPSMPDARDAVLQADQATNGGANTAALWPIFARHGLGYSAKGVDAPSRADIFQFSSFQIAAYDVPPSLQTGNQPPVIAPVVPPVAALGGPYSYQVQASDPEGGKLTYTLASGPAGIALSPTGLLQGNAPFTTQLVKIVVTDPQGARAALVFLLSVETKVPIGGNLNVSGADGSTGFAVLDIPANTPAFQVLANAVSGDPDLAIVDPTGTLVDVEVRTGLAEGAMISQPMAGRWTIVVVGYVGYSGQLSATIPAITTLTSPASLTASGAIATQSVYKITVPAGATSLTIQTSGGTGDVDLFASLGQIPACDDAALSLYCVYDYTSAQDGNNEIISLANPAAGDWYITLSGYDVYAGVTFTASYSAPTAAMPVISSIVNGASFASGIAPGSWITIRGTSLSATTRLWTSADFTGTSLPTMLDNVKVTVNGKSALIYYISPTQINALAPDDTTTGPVTVTVTNTLGTASGQAQLVQFAPAFFEFDPQNRKYLAAVFPDGTFSGPAGLFGASVVTKPVAPGGRLLLYATGLGPTTPATPANQIVSGAPPLAAADNFSVTIGGAKAVVEFVGLISNGLYQINVVVPAVANGDQAVVATSGGVSSAATGYLSVQQ